MSFGFFLSWLVNLVILSVVVAMLANYKKYYLEGKPWVLFILVVLLPTLLEFGALIASGQPFLKLILPAEWGWMFG